MVIDYDQLSHVLGNRSTYVPVELELRSSATPAAKLAMVISSATFVRFFMVSLLVISGIFVTLSQC
jgi:hypothetical protein